jgi:hypothetical protein
MAWADMGDLDRAVEFGQEALKVTPSDPELWTTLARFYEAPGPREPGATGAPESGSSHSAEALALPLRWSLLGKAKRGLASSIAWDRPTVISLDISTCRAVLSRRSFNTA